MSTLVTPFPKVVVLILNWNGWRDTLQCVESVRQSLYSNFHIVVIDNHSDDDSVAQIGAGCVFGSSADPRREAIFKILETKENLGYAGGNNVGFDYALTLNADYVLVLNNDVTIIQHCIFSLVDAGERNPDIGVLGCFVNDYNASDTFLYAGLHAPKTLHVPEMGNYYGDEMLDVRGSFEPVPVDSAHGCAFAVKRAVLADIKGFDPAFFAIHEEVDFCMRVREAGWKVAAVPAAAVFHKVGASFGPQSANRVYYDVRNRVRYFANRARASNTRLPTRFWARYLVSGVGRTIKSLLRGEKETAHAVMQGAYDGVRGIGGKRRSKH